ncbi:MAG: LysE family translocator [Saprospiraceae bacterium]
MVQNLYLLYLAYLELKSNQIEFSENKDNREQNINYIKLYKKGFMMNVLNPKVTLFFIAFLPQFVSEKTENYMLSVITLGFIFMIQAIIIFTIVAFIAGKIRIVIQKPSFSKIISRGKIVFFVFLAFLLLMQSKN